MLFNRYSAVCRLSMTNTYEGGATRWTMYDDFSVMNGLWGLSWFLMFFFLFFGLSQAYVGNI